MKFIKSLLPVAMLAATTLSGMSASAEEFRMGLITPPPHQWTKTAHIASDEIKAKTDGRVEILIFPSGQLGNEAQMLQQLQSGVMDFAFFTLGEFANRDPNYGIFLAPYIAKDVADAQALLKGETATKLLEQLNRFGLVGFGYGMAGMRQIVMANDVNSIEDLVDRKIRTIPFAPELDFWKKVGAAPTPMPLPALYDAFANGQVDGMQIDFEGTWNSKYYSHAGVILESNHMMFPMIAVGSARKWAALGEKDREVIMSVMKAQLDELVASYAGIDANYLEQLKGTSVPVKSINRDFFGAAIEKWYVEWRAKAPLLVDLEKEASRL